MNGWLGGCSSEPHHFMWSGIARGGVAEFFETAHDYVQEWSILDSDDEGGDRSQQSYARSTAVARVGSDASHSRGGRVRRRRGGKASASSARRNRVSRRSNAPLPPPDDGPRRLSPWVVCSVPSWLPNPNSVGPIFFYKFFHFFVSAIRAVKFTGRYARVLNTDDRLFPVQPPPFDAAFPCGCAAHGKYSLVTDLELPLTVPQVRACVCGCGCLTILVVCLAGNRDEKRVGRCG